MGTKLNLRGGRAPVKTSVKVSNLVAVVEHDSDSEPDHLLDENRYKGEPEATQRRYRAEDLKRVEAWKRDEWHYVGLFLRAELEITVGKLTYSRAAKVETAGLWGIESDSEPGYFKSVAGEEYEALKDLLRALGVREFPDLKMVQWKE